MFENVRASRQLEAHLRDLHSSDSNQRLAAVEALGALGGPHNIDPLVDMLRDSSPAVRAAAAKALGEISDGRAAPGLLKALLDNDLSVRTAAGQALSDLTRDVPVQAAISALEGQGTFARAVVARTLGKWGDHKAIPSLINALGDNEGEIRKVVAKALSRLGERAWVIFVDGTYKDFARMAASGDPRAVAPLLKALEHGDSSNRAAAARGLARFEADTVVPHLLTHMKDDNSEVRQSVAEALGALGDQRALEPLLFALDDYEPAVRAAAMVSLDKLDTALQKRGTAPVGRGA